MAKSSGSKSSGKGGKGGKETIKAPTGKATSDGSKMLRAGHSSGGRTMADASVAKREGVKPGSGKKR